VSEQIKAELIDYMGDDLAVANAARVSFNKESTDFTFRKDVEKGSDEGLIEYLASHDHWTPFAHTAIKLRCSAPVPIRTQAFKHKIGMVENEESRRYISSTPEIFIPEFFRAKPEGSIKQGSAGEHERSGIWVEAYKAQVNSTVSVYEAMLSDGICPEQARFILPQGAIVNWIWTGNLVSFANFYLKRTHPTAQKEVEELAESVGSIVENLFPVSWLALTKNKETKND
jgi:thymidylate synthase (FAD)